MACYKVIDTSPRFIAVDLQRQLVPGTFEHALDCLIDHEIDLSGFEARYRNDATGAARIAGLLVAFPAVSFLLLSRARPWPYPMPRKRR